MGARGRGRGCLSCEGFGRQCMGGGQEGFLMCDLGLVCTAYLWNQAHCMRQRDPFCTLATPNSN